MSVNHEVEDDPYDIRIMSQVLKWQDIEIGDPKYGEVKVRTRPSG